MIYTVDDIKGMLNPIFSSAPIYKAVLFGSYAKGVATEASDIDIVIDSKGELAKNIDIQTQETYSQIPWKSIRGMRNKIIHDYDNVDFSVLCSTIKNSIPDFKKQLNEILSNLTQKRIADMLVAAIFSAA